MGSSFDRINLTLLVGSVMQKCATPPDLCPSILVGNYVQLPAIPSHLIFCKIYEQASWFSESDVCMFAY